MGEACINFMHADPEFGTCRAWLPRPAAALLTPVPPCSKARPEQHSAAPLLPRQLLLRGPRHRRGRPTTAAVAPSHGTSWAAGGQGPPSHCH